MEWLVDCTFERPDPQDLSGTRCWGALGFRTPTPGLFLSFHRLGIRSKAPF